MNLFPREGVSREGAFTGWGDGSGNGDSMGVDGFCFGPDLVGLWFRNVVLV